MWGSLSSCATVANRCIRAPLGLLLCTWIACAQTAAKIDFLKQVAPILEQNCVGCHSANKAAGALAITSRQALIDRKVVTPGRPDASPFYVRAALPSANPKAMPPGGPRLSDQQLATLKNWIQEGAEWPATVALKAPPPNASTS